MAKYMEPKILEECKDDSSQTMKTYNNLLCYQAANSIMLLNSVELDPYDQKIVDESRVGSDECQF